MELESHGNYDRRIEIAQREAEALANELAQCNVQKTHIESTKGALHSSNKAAEVENQELEREYAEKASRAARSTEITAQRNTGARHNIKKMRLRAAELRAKSENLSAALDFATRLHTEVTESRNIIRRIA
jgi:capsule polysaccharide export protein KpsE/RkpR